MIINVYNYWHPTSCKAYNFVFEGHACRFNFEAIALKMYKDNIVSKEWVVAFMNSAQTIADRDTREAKVMYSLILDILHNNVSYIMDVYDRILNARITTNKRSRNHLIRIQEDAVFSGKGPLVEQAKHVFVRVQSNAVLKTAWRTVLKAAESVIFDRV